MEVTMAEAAAMEKQGCGSRDILSDWSSLASALEDALAGRVVDKQPSGWKEHFLSIWYHLCTTREAQVSTGTILPESYYRQALRIGDGVVESDDIRIAHLYFKLCLLMESSSRMEKAFDYWSKSNAICTAKLTFLLEKQKSLNASSEDSSAFQCLLLQEILVLYATKLSGSTEIKSKSRNVSDPGMNDPMDAASAAEADRSHFRNSILSHWRKLRAFLEDGSVGGVQIAVDKQKSLLPVWNRLYALGEAAIILAGKMDPEFHYIEALDTLKHLVPSDDIRVADLYFKICLILESCSRIKDALIHCKKACLICRLGLTRLRLQKENQSSSGLDQDEYSVLRSKTEFVLLEDAAVVYVEKLRDLKMRNKVKIKRKSATTFIPGCSTSINVESDTNGDGIKPKRKANPDAGRQVPNPRILSNINQGIKKMKVV